MYNLASGAAGESSSADASSASGSVDAALGACVSGSIPSALELETDLQREVTDAIKIRNEDGYDAEYDRVDTRLESVKASIDVLDECTAVAMARLRDGDLSVEDCRYLSRDLLHMSDKRIELAGDLDAAIRRERDRYALARVDECFSELALDLLQKSRSRTEAFMEGDGLTANEKTLVQQLGEQFSELLKDFIVAVRSEIDRIDRVISERTAGGEGAIRNRSG